MRCTLCCLAFAALCLVVSSATSAEDNPLAPYLKVPGAKTTLPVSSAKSSFSLEFAQDAQGIVAGTHHVGQGAEHDVPTDRLGRCRRGRARQRRDCSRRRARPFSLDRYRRWAFHCRQQRAAAWHLSLQ